MWQESVCWEANNMQLHTASSTPGGRCFFENHLDIFLFMFYYMFSITK